jgi:uncharacterized membrane-anchored protein YitT (DUF2179 family)
MKPKVKSTAAKLLIVLLGNILYGVTVAVFIEPSGLITGGVTGIAIALERLTGFSVSIYTFALNLVLFVLGIVFLGREFAATTAVSTVVYPVAMHLTERVLTAGHSPTISCCAPYWAACSSAFPWAWSCGWAPPQAAWISHR